MKLFPDATLIYLSKGAKVKAESSRRDYGKVLRLLHSRHRTLDVNDYTDQLLTDFCSERGLAPATLKKRRAILRSFWEWAQWYGISKSNPAAPLKFTISPGNFGVREGNWLTEAQAVRLIEACPTDLVGQRDRVILMTGLFTGARRATLANLQWDQFDKGLTTLTFVGKGSKLAVVAVPEQLRSVLKAWRHVATGAYVFPRNHIDLSNNAEAFLNVDQPLGGDGIANAVRRAGQRIGIEKLAPHDLRRSFAAILEDKGTTIADISRAMGHENISITSGYMDRRPSKRLAVTSGFALEMEMR